MIIECPNCKARYDVGPAQSLSGRKVRCSQCQLVWEPDDAAARGEPAMAPPQAEAEQSAGFAGDDRFGPPPMHGFGPDPQGHGSHSPEPGAEHPAEPSPFPGAASAQEPLPGSRAGNAGGPEMSNVRFAIPGSSPDQRFENSFETEERFASEGPVPPLQREPSDAGYGFDAGLQHGTAPGPPPPVSGQVRPAPPFHGERDRWAAGQSPQDYSPHRENFGSDGPPPGMPAGNVPRFEPPLPHPAGNGIQPPHRAGFASEFDDVAGPDAIATTNRPVTRPLPGRSKLGLLAIVIGWIALLSVLGGLFAVFWFMPSRVVARLPGTADLYRSLGREVDATGLAFRNVSYRWVSTDVPSVILVQGMIDNIAGREVEVPPVVFVLLDGSGGEVFKWAKRVRIEPLEPGGSTVFSALVPAPVSLTKGLDVQFAAGG